MATWDRTEENKQTVLSTLPRQLPLDFLRTITEQFSKERIIGTDAFGTVYRGTLPDGQSIAVKKLVENAPLARGKAFTNGVQYIMDLQNENIVMLVGYCHEGQLKLVQNNGRYNSVNVVESLLCYEYLDMGSLHQNLFEKHSNMDWRTRFEIIKGICSGLLFLHRIPIIHMDLKAENILFDNNMTPKIAHIGLSRLFGQEQTRANTHNDVGSYGYIAPEYVNRGEISTQSDIYSLGLLILEITTREKNQPKQNEPSARNFIEEVHHAWTDGFIMSMYPCLEVANLQEVKICIIIGLECVQIDRKKRPSIENIVQRLHGHYPKTKENMFNKGEASSTKDLSATEPMVMTFQELHRMTDGFSEDQLLGTGGYGRVYKGVLDNGEEIAIKKLKSNPELVEEIFKNELLNLMKVRHENIIRLVGYCSETQERVVEHQREHVLAGEQQRALCLEYMQGGNLDEHLSDESHGLDWETRYKIIKGICQGLKHLHTGSVDPIYHLDLKPANILLDKDRIPKIGDFGLSRILDSAQTFFTKTFLGTRGYMPPEYIDGQEISPKFDVYSLGVIIIQVVAGKEGYYKSADMTSQDFIDHVTENWSKRVQEKQTVSDELLQVRKCIEIGLRCVEAKRVNRPTISEIVEELNMISEKCALPC